MSTDANRSTTLWVGKEKGVWKTLAVTPRGSACPVTKKPDSSSSGWTSSPQRKNRKQNEMGGKVASSRPQATDKRRNTQSSSNIKALAAVARDFAERDCPELLAMADDNTSSGTSETQGSESPDHGISMDLGDMSDLTEFTSDDECGSVYADSEF